jgi:hypothetical protein
MKWQLKYSIKTFHFVKLFAKDRGIYSMQHLYLIYGTRMTKRLMNSSMMLRVVVTNKLNRLGLAFFKQIFFLGKHNNKPNLTASYKLAPPSQPQQ